MDPVESTRTWRRAAAIAALALIALALFLFRDRREVAPSSPSAPLAPLAPLAPAATMRTLLKPTPSLAQGQIDVCGHGPVPDDALAGIQAEAQSSAEKALGRTAVTLAASPNERDAAMGLFLGRLGIPQEVPTAYLREHLDCQHDLSCRSHVMALGAGADALRDDLAKMAWASRDPHVYALAFHVCGDRSGSGAQGACILLSVERWAELEPDNGVPWLLVASAAQASNDSSTRDRAIWHASTAQRFEPHYPNSLSLLQSPDLRGESPQTRSAVADELFGLERALPTLNYGPFFQFCNAPSGADAGRVGVCGNLANLLLQQDRTLAGFSTGAALAKAAGFPAQDVKALRDQRDAMYLALQNTRGSGGLGALGGDCEDLARFERLAADTAELGQVGAARKLIQENRATDTKSSN
jgi:hypothetical protein